jgi:hypothetical protein
MSDYDTCAVAGFTAVCAVAGFTAVCALAVPCPATIMASTAPAAIIPRIVLFITAPDFSSLTN